MLTTRERRESRCPLAYRTVPAREAHSAPLGFLGSKQAVWEGPRFLGSLTALIASFAGSLGVVPGFERLLVYIASVGNAFVKIVPDLFCCSVFTA